MSRRAAFIDRDGVLNEDHAYVHRIADFEFIPGAIEALKRLQDSGYLLVVITNQSGIARGIYTESDYNVLDAYLRERLSEAGVTLDSVQYCPHLPDAQVEHYRRECDCRKPKPGMILRAASLLDIDLARSVLVGDRSSDVQAGRAAGVGRCFLVRSGHALRDGDSDLADGVFADFAQCVAVLISSDS
jgi:D-glycero-D-manno-heptose 1,7-bisphosphate phosphatase